MAKFYSVAKISERISETPEGFLVCEGVAITRAGDLMYSPSETPVTPGNGHTIISRTVEDIHDPATIASFEGKPVTINHPDDFVTPENWRELAVGVVQNVRPGEGEDEDKLLADLLITDFEAINAVKSKRLREVSCGYEAEYVEEAPGKGRQENIIGNHVALVAAGRCGSECAIFDHAPKKEIIPMTMKQKIMGLFGKALDEAMPDETPPAADEVPTDVGAALAAEVPAEGGDQEVPSAGSEDPVAKLSEEVAKLSEEVATLKMALAKLMGIEEQEHGQEIAELDKSADMCKDADTIARAEILAPGIAKTADVKAKSLKAAYATEDGKAVIDTVLAGKAFDSADKDMLFIAASELLKSTRRQQLNTRVSLDSLPGMKAGEMTPEKINEMNAARYGNRK